MHNTILSTGRGVRWGRAQRMEQIYMIMSHDEHDVHTVNSIAKLIGIKPSTYLRGMLADMASRGDLNVYTEYASDGSVIRRLYSVPSRSYNQLGMFDIQECPDCGAPNALNSHCCEVCNYEYGRSS